MVRVAEDLIKNLKACSEGKNKAASKRARKNTLELAELGKKFRKVSVEAEKSAD